MLDAGHGGKDPGTVNGKHYEKTINLAVVKAAGAILERNPAIKVIYTRSTDRFVELVERSNIAARAKADLFVSIHTNSSPNKKARGTETYIMGVDKSKANLGVAMRENGVISLEGDYSTVYEGYDPQSSESLIMFSLMQYSFTRESLDLAAIFQKSYKGIGRQDNGVRQDAFLVLWRNAMPSVLTELGYLSNTDEVHYLISDKGHNELAGAVATSIEHYVSTAAHAAATIAVTADRVSSGGESLGFFDDAQPSASSRDSPVKQSGSNGVHYAVQVCASSARTAINSVNFGALVMEICERKIGKLYKYTVGELFFYKEALLLQDKIRRYFADAFIVAFDGKGGQIPIGAARKIIEKQ